MRNLKKILAMVLALVMSLSLMATASATDFTDDSSINDTYKIATEVLSGLGVFNGYKDGSFQPQGSITRAETAAIIYRIVTGDVDDKQVGIYADYNIFPDVPGTAWHAGYVNFCANAEYIKGRTDGKFDPQGKVTGYEALAMILRAIGYTANGGFTGPDWAVQTARTAESRKITKNINTGTLGEYATRETVAEILFQAILVNMVDHNVLHTLNGEQGYTETNMTLGYKTFKLEEFVAVVTGNEFADLNSSWVLPEGTTQVLAFGEEDVRNLDTMTKITDIGESRLFYTQNGRKVLSMTDSGLNTTKEYGLAVDIRTAPQFRDASGMIQATETEFYTDFEPLAYRTSDWRIEYEIELDNWSASEMIALKNRNGGDYTGPVDGMYTYTKRIPAGDPITNQDYSFMNWIFTYSNGKQNLVDKNTNSPYPYDGKVFVATQSNYDISDDMSFKQFEDKYINDVIKDQNWETSRNGEWVKFIDNDGDGNAEYAFLTQYVLTEAVSSYTNKDGDLIMQYAQDYDYYSWTDWRAQYFTDDDHTYDDWDYTVRYMKDDEPVERDVAVGDIVLAAYIDNQYLVSDAESVTTQVNSYNYKDDAIVAADGNTYTQSYIGNATGMQQLLASAANKTTYEMFLDKFGFIRAYRLPGGTKYALVTELYFTNGQQGNMVQDWPMTVELVTPNEDGTVLKKEYNLSNRDTEMRGLAPWTQISNLAQSGNYYNWLQPAIAHLGVGWNGMTPVRVLPNLDQPILTYWSNSLQLVRPILSLNGSTEFNYGEQNYIGRGQLNYGNVVPTKPTTSFTNVAVVSIDGDNATVNGAAQVRLNQAGQASGNRVAGDYAVDYIQLTTDNVAAGAVAFPVANSPVGNTVAYNRVVNANNDTEIYVVYDGNVKYFKGYKNMPALNADTVGNIHAAYAVARNTNTGTGNGATGINYWIADVLVFEVEGWYDLKDTSISLAYWTVSQQLASATSVTVDTLNTKNLKVQLQPTGMAWSNSANWWTQWGNGDNVGYGWRRTTFNGQQPATGYGFYKLYNDKLVSEGLMDAAAIEKIVEKYNDSGIFAGVVTREVGLAENAGYIPVNFTQAQDANGDYLTEAYISIGSDKVFSITDGSWKNGTGTQWQSNYWEANNLWYNNTVYSQVKANDQIIWVGGTNTNRTVSGSSFLVDMGSNVAGANNLVANLELWQKSPDWLKNLWADIWAEQIPTTHPTTGEYQINVVFTEEDASVGTTLDAAKVVRTVLKYATPERNKPYTVTFADLAKEVAGYNITDVIGCKGVATTTVGGAIDGFLGGKSGDKSATIPASATTNSSLGALSGTPKGYTLVVEVAKKTYSLQVKGADTYTTTADLKTQDDVGGNVTQTNFTLDTTGATKTDLFAGAEFKVSFLPAAGKVYSAQITDGTLEGANTAGAITKCEVGLDGKITLKGTVTGNTVLEITEDSRTYKANWSGDNITTGDQDITWTNDLDGTRTSNVVSITPAAGYMVDNINDLSARTVGGVSLTVIKDATNKFKFRGTMDADDDIIITVNDAKAAIVPVTLKVASGVNAWYYVGELATANRTDFNFKLGDTDTANTGISLNVDYGQHVYVITTPNGSGAGTQGLASGSASVDAKYVEVTAGTGEICNSYGPITATGVVIDVQ